MLSLGIVGAGRRIQGVYGPILNTLSSEYTVVGLTTRSSERGQEAARMLKTSYFADLDALCQAHPDILLVSVSYAANDEVAQQAVQTGLPCLLETPAATQSKTIEGLMATAAGQRSLVEVAEQYPMRPMERLKQQLIASGVFGTVYAASNDFMGHDYHGFALLRSYLGWPSKPTAIWGWRKTHPVASHYFSPSAKWREDPDEEWWRAMIEFEGQRFAQFDFTSLSYGSPLRWERSTRFYGQKGMARGDELTLMNEHGTKCRPIRIERRIHNVGGMEVLDALVAHAERPLAEWQNPFHQFYLDDEAIAVASCLRSLSQALSHGVPLEYGLAQARVDQVLTEGMRRSAANGGEKVLL